MINVSIAGTSIERMKIRRMGNGHIVGDFVSGQYAFALFTPKVTMVAPSMTGIILHIKGQTDE